MTAESRLEKKLVLVALVATRLVKVALVGIDTAAPDRSRGPLMVVVPFRVVGPEAVSEPLTVVVARLVVPVAVRLPVVMEPEFTVAKSAVPVAVILVPVALPKSKLVMAPVTADRKLVRKLPLLTMF